MDSTNNTLYRLVLEFIAKHKSYVVLYILYLCVIPIKEVLMPHLFGKIIKAFQGNQPVMTIVVAAILTWIFVHSIITYIDWQDIFFYPAMMEFLRSKTLAWLFDIYRDDYEDMKTTDTIVKISKLPQLIYGFLDMWKKVFIPMIVTFFIAVIYITLQDATTGIVLMIVLVIYVMVILASPNKCGQVSQEKDRSINTLNEETEDTLRNMMAVLNAQHEKFEVDRTSSYNAIYSDLCQRTMWCIIGVQCKLVPCQLFFMVFAIWRCYGLMATKKMDIGQSISILIILLFVSNSLNKLTNEVRDLIIKYGMIRESMTLFDKRPSHMPDDPPTPPPNVTDFEIYADQVSYRYNASVQDILNGVSIGIRPGEKVLIEGRIGTGKSTLLKLIMRYKNPTSGMMYLNGAPYTDISIETVRKRIGYVPQASMLFNRSIYDNIVYGSEGKYSVDEIYRLIDQLRLNHIFERFEDGLLSSVGKNGSRLSGGQRQIVWILRVLLQDPQILLLDEPTASIDEDTKDSIYALLESLMRTRTVIMVTHDKTLEAHATRIITVKDGTILRDMAQSRGVYGEVGTVGTVGK